jgi:glucose-1-phosphate thymidylyltransferase
METHLTDTLKIVIPMAGWGTRMRPHTWSKPKPLISVGGKTSLDHVLDMFQTLPDPANTEYIFIVGPFLGETQVPAYIAEHYPHIRAHYVVQREMKGQSHALLLSREHLTGPMIMCFSDTLMETDFSFLANENSDGVAWVKPVPDPRRFGVAETGPDGCITRLIEKPQSMENNLVVVGCYYFKSSEAVLSAIEEQIERNVMLKNEYFLADAINIMLQRGACFRANPVEIWLDTGTIEATLETNRYLLDHGRSNDPSPDSVTGGQIIAPVFIHPSARISDSVIGPYASIGADCVISASRVENSILEPGAQIQAAALIDSLIGKQARVEGRSAESAMTLNLGDHSTIRL